MSTANHSWSTEDSSRGDESPGHGTNPQVPYVQGGMELSGAVEFARANRKSVLITIRSNGRPQLSNVMHHVFDDGLIRISITADSPVKSPPAW